MEKSSVLFSSNTPETQKEWTKAALRVKEVECFDYYLGLPALIGHANTRLFLLLRIESGKNYKVGKENYSLEWVKKF